MTSTANQIVSLLELGDYLTWVTRQDRKDALAALAADTAFDATINSLEASQLLKTMLNRYSDETDPSLYDLLMTMASKASAISAATIESKLRIMPLFDRDALHLVSTLGPSTTIFGIAAELSRSMTRLGLKAPSSLNCSTAPAPAVPAARDGSFTGSGATGRDIFANPVRPDHQVRIYYEQKNDPNRGKKGRDPGAAGPISRAYSNPLWAGLAVPPTPAERQAQAARISCLQISSLFSDIYGSVKPRRSAVMAAAARVHRLTPEIIGAIILAEQRDQSRNEDALDFTAATSRISRKTTSIGLGQVRDDTAISNDLFADLLPTARRSSLGNAQVAALLSCDEFNIFACARYIRVVADLAGKATSKQIADSLAVLPGIDFAAYAKHGSTWPPTNIVAMGSEYTSFPWDGKLKQWGSFVGAAFADMHSTSITW